MKQPTDLVATEMPASSEGGGQIEEFRERVSGEYTRDSERAPVTFGQCRAALAALAARDAEIATLRADSDIDGPPDFATWRDAYEDLLVHSEADRAETATLRAALEKIADTSNWSTDQKVQIAVDTLANLKAPTP